ncbi:hypothetical protein CHUAL_008981 [Chamberlinius hualienensis]
MLDFFTIFSKGGIVLWCFQGTSDLFTPSVNALIKSVILQERGGTPTYTHEGLMLQYRLDNEFELIFVVAYQKILQLSYIDKFLDDIQLEFRDKYKQDLQQGNLFNDFEFKENFSKVLNSSEEWAKRQNQSKRAMRSYDESGKSKKTVASMIESRKDLNVPKKGPKQPEMKPQTEVKDQSKSISDKDLNQEIIEQNLKKLKAKNSAKNAKKVPVEKVPVKSPRAKGKEMTTWALNGGGGAKDKEELDRTKKWNGIEKGQNEPLENVTLSKEMKTMVNTLQGDLPNIDDEGEDFDFIEEEEEEVPEKGKKSKKSGGGGGGYGGMFSMFKGLVGSKNVTQEDMVPILEKMREHLIAKNVAADISDKLCNSVSSKLEGKVLGTFQGVASTVKSTLNEALIQLLSPRYRIDILRDVLNSKAKRRPYTITFCGVNGVGKSTNLAKICFWMIENNFRVLVAACDTFRAGAVEQLRTHVRHLNALHPAEKHNARDTLIDVVLVDTAGRMQDNEPLMRSLSKLIHINEPDLVLFVGEALVGNEAVDQLVKFNQALADHSTSNNPHLIDGIVLTKFDTIDDKVGAAISMTYITGQPIVFVGTGQTYVDLKQLNAKAVVKALMK